MLSMVNTHYCLQTVGTCRVLAAILYSECRLLVAAAKCRRLWYMFMWVSHKQDLLWLRKSYAVRDKSTIQIYSIMLLW